MADVIANIVGISIFVFLIGFSIGFHEFGHFITAKRYGVKVTEFMVGFGPKIWGKTKGETTYGLKLLPVGGYVRIIGMFPPPPDAPPGMERVGSTGRFSGLIEQARESALAEIEPGDEDRVFYKLPVRKRIVVMMAGTFLNLFLAIVLFSIALVGVGLPQVTTTVRAIVPCVPTADFPFGDEEDGQCPPGSRPSPATDANIAPGDTVTAIDGATVTTWDDVSATLRDLQPGDSVDLTLLRGDESLLTTVTLAEAVYPVVNEEGDPTGATESRAFVGIRPDSTYVPLSLGEVPGYMWEITTLSVQALISLPARLWELTQTLATGGERDPEGPVSVVGVSRLGGEIAATEEPFKAKAASFLGLAASLNLFLFMFNLLPLLPLDGGHAAAASFEGIRRWWARLRGRSDPGPVDTARLLPLTYAVAAVLLVSGVIVIFADLVKPITLGG